MEFCIHFVRSEYLMFRVYLPRLTVFKTQYWKFLTGAYYRGSRSRETPKKIEEAIQSMFKVAAFVKIGTSRAAELRFPRLYFEF